MMNQHPLSHRSPRTEELPQHRPRGFFSPQMKPLALPREAVRLPYLHPLSPPSLFRLDPFARNYPGDRSPLCTDYNEFPKVRLAPTKISKKKFGVVQGYAVNTHNGLVRPYNEDRVSISLKLRPPANRTQEQWPPCSYFGIFDGHGGKGCSGFLRDNLHQFIINDPSFPSNPKEAIVNSFETADQVFLEKSRKTNDFSGSCAVIVVIVGEQCYIANTGDSRAVLSANRGKKVYVLTKDHKPNDPKETERVKANGGQVYFAGVKDEEGRNIGCFRVFPGRLAVSRSFGDLKAKDAALGGLPGVVVASPGVKSIKLTEDHDFIFMASDGVFDKMTNMEVVDSVWSETKKSSMKQVLVQAVESVFNEGFRRLTTDNLTVLCIALQGLADNIAAKQSHQYIELYIYEIILNYSLVVD